MTRTSPREAPVAVERPPVRTAVPVGGAGDRRRVGSGRGPGPSSCAGRLQVRGRLRARAHASAGAGAGSPRRVHAWRSSLHVRIGAITMVVAGTVVVIVSLVLFSQIRDQLLSVKRDAAIDQAQAGVVYARDEVGGHRHR